MSTEPSAQSAEPQVADMRARASSDPAARDEAWQWIVDLKERAGSDQKAAEAELDALFRLGVPPTGLDGPTDGILVTTTTNRLLDPAVRAITGLWKPWQGKRFDAAAATGDNRMVSGAAPVSKLLWPLYKMRHAAGGKLAFDFKTYTEAGKADPDVQVMVIKRVRFLHGHGR